ncbi:MAG: hypothetical protein WBQ21_10380 [Solirubrobacteraceae bacterium]
MLQLLKRTGLALLLMTVGLVLLALGVSFGVWIAVAGLVTAFVVNLIAPWQWNMGWRKMRE